MILKGPALVAGIEAISYASRVLVSPCSFLITALTDIAISLTVAIGGVDRWFESWWQQLAWPNAKKSCPFHAWIACYHRLQVKGNEAQRKKVKQVVIE